MGCLGESLLRVEALAREGPDEHRPPARPVPVVAAGRAGHRARRWGPGPVVGWGLACMAGRAGGISASGVTRIMGHGRGQQKSAGNTTAVGRPPTRKTVSCSIVPNDNCIRASVSCADFYNNVNAENKTRTAIL